MANINVVDYRMTLHRAGSSDISFEISDEDNTNAVKYYGYLAYNGSWLIMQWDTNNGTYRYAAGKAATLAYATAWTGRGGLTYGYYSALVGSQI